MCREISSSDPAKQVSKIVNFWRTGCKTAMNFFMRQALDEARKAFNKGEVPIGAVVVYGDRIVGRATT